MAQKGEVSTGVHQSLHPMDKVAKLPSLFSVSSLPPLPHQVKSPSALSISLLKMNLHWPILRGYWRGRWRGSGGFVFKRPDLSLLMSKLPMRTARRGHYRF